MPDRKQPNSGIGANEGSIGGAPGDSRDGFSIARRREARRVFRHQTSIEARVLINRNVHPVVIRDISKLGARLLGRGDWARGDEIVLEVNDMQAVATVVWVDDDHSGVNFHKAIDPSRVVREEELTPMMLSPRSAQQMQGGITALTPTRPEEEES